MVVGGAGGKMKRKKVNASKTGQVACQKGFTKYETQFQPYGQSEKLNLRISDLWSSDQLYFDFGRKTNIAKKVFLM